MPDSKAGSIAFLIALIFPFIALLSYTNHKGLQGEVVVVKEANAQAEPQNNSVPVVITTPAPEVSLVDTSEQESVENYIKIIFGSEWRVARAVHYNECGPSHRDYPRNCRLTTGAEDSIGIFQINIQSKDTKIHWSRIPGETLEDKVEWLNDPYNNTLMAYWIFTKSSWYPWSAYTSGRYLDDM